MFCEKCGQKLEDDGIFCPACGHRVTEDAPAVDSVTEEVTSAPEASEEVVEAEVTIATEATPAVEEAPVIEETVVEAAPAVEEAVVVDAAPVASETVVVDATPVIEENVAVDAAPVIEETVVETKTTENETQNNAFNPIPPEPEKTKGPGIGTVLKNFFAKNKVLVIILAVIIVLALAIIPNLKVIENAVRRAGNPTKYLNWVMNDKETELADDFASVYDSFVSVLKANKYSGSISVELDEKGISLLEDETGGEDMNWLSQATISGEVNRKGNMLGMNAQLTSKKYDLASVDFVMDLKNGDMYLGIPAYSSSYMMVNGDDIGFDDDIAEEIEQAMSSYEQIMEVFPASKDLQKIFNSYFKTSIGSIDEKNIKIKKSKNLRAGGINQKVTQLTVSVDDRLCRDVVKGVIEQMLEDKDLKSVYMKSMKQLAACDIDGVSDIDYEDAYDEFLDELEAAKKEVSDISFRDEIDVNLFVSNKGELIGMEVEEGGTSLQMVKVKKGGKVAHKIIASEGYYSAEITGSGKESAGKLTGEYSVSVNGAKVCKLDVKNLDVSGLFRGELNGDIIIEPTDEMYRSAGLGALDDYKLEIDSSMKMSGGKMAMKVVDGRKSLGTIEVAFSASSGAKVSAPASKNVIEIQSEDDFADYFETLDFGKLEKALDKLGAPDELLDYVEELEDLDADDLVRALYYLF